MGVKSTVHLTRRQAEDKAVELILNQLKCEALARFVVLSDRELEDTLEEMNDARNPDGRGFENYSIVPDPDDEHRR